jgi:hypothetical protein
MLGSDKFTFDNNMDEPIMGEDYVYATPGEPIEIKQAIYMIAGQEIESYKRLVETKYNKELSNQKKLRKKSTNIFTKKKKRK